MRTRADLQAAAAGAGLVIDAIEAVPVAGGGTALATRMTFTDPWSAADLLFTLAEEDAGDPIVRAWSLEILTATADELGLALGPTITPELRDAYARALHANVQTYVKFVHEPVETFQSARVTMQTGAGDCDDHARLLYALAVAGNLPAKLVFFEQDDQPVHVVAQLEDADGTWQWAETTIDAAYGEEPHDALARLDGQLDDANNPLSHAAQPIAGPWGFVTPGDVQARKDQVAAEIASTDTDAVNCGKLDSGTLSAWNLFVVGWQDFYADAPNLFNAGSQGRQVADYVDQLDTWQSKLTALGCTMSAAPLPKQTDSGIGSTITLVAVAAAVVAGAYAVVEVMKVVPRARRTNRRR